MKKTNLIKYIISFCLCIACLICFSTCTKADWVEDAANGVSYENKSYISSHSAGKWGNGGDSTSYIYLQNPGDRITNVTSKSKYVLAKKTYESFAETITPNGSEISYTETGLSFFGKKKGTYKVTFDIVDKAGNLRCRKTIKVYVDKFSYNNGIKKVTYAGKNIENYKPFTTKTKGKLKVTLKKGYSLVSIYVYKINKKGQWKGKKVKNNKRITLATNTQYTYKSDYQTEFNTPLFSETSIEITIKNKKTKQVDTFAFPLLTLNAK